MFNVVFIVLATGRRITRKFDSLYLARKFVNKCRFSTKVRVVSHPNFNV